MEQVLWLRNAYCQAYSTSFSGVNAQRVEAEIGTPLSKAAATIFVAAATSVTAAAETNLTASLVKKLLVEVRHFQQLKVVE